jgi:hypothetical protein
MLNALRPLLLLTACSVALPAFAQESAPPPIEIRSQREDAGARIRQVERSGGRVLQAEPMQHGGREVYRFKVLTPEGRVRVLQGDPQGAGTGMSSEPRRFERPREPAFAQSDALTARRQSLRDDAAADVARERSQRPAPQEPRAAGEPASD